MQNPIHPRPTTHAMNQRPQPARIPHPAQIAPPAQAAGPQRSPAGRYPLPRFTVQQVQTTLFRRLLGYALLFGAAIFLLLALAALRSNEVHSLAPLGVGRIVDEAGRNGWGITGLLSALENLHCAVGCAIFGLAMALGAIPPASPLPGEVINLRRRGDARLHFPALAGGLLIFWFGLAISLGGIPLVGGLAEAVGMSLAAWSSWRVFVPEARHLLTVITDTDMGWSNRILVEGGKFIRNGVRTIRPDMAVHAIVITPLWLRIFGTGHLTIAFTQSDGSRGAVMLRAAGPLRELSDVAGYINGRWQRALRPTNLQGMQQPLRPADYL